MQLKFDEKRKNIFGWLLLALLILVCSYPLFLNIDKLSVRMWDEARNGINAIEMLQNGKLFVTHFDGQPDMWNTKPPLMIWSIALSMKLFGINTFALRLPSVFVCLFLVVYTFFYFKKHYNSHSIGVLFGLILVTSIGFIDYHVARNGDFDGMLSVFMFMYASQFYIYTVNHKRKHLIYFALYLGLAILTKGIAACMILPGLLICFFAFKSNYELLKRKEIYLLPFIGLLIGISYYLIREHLNAGYIKAVIENEITGRYAETNEGHTGPISYYWDLLSDQHYRYWIYFLPFSILIVFLRALPLFKKIMFFALIQSLVYSIVITISHTKLPWYDAPLFPFFALINALGIYQFVTEITSFVRRREILSMAVKGLVIVLICIVPFQNILATSVRGVKETYYPELFYGDFMKVIFSNYHNNKITVVSEDYNPHLIFYKKAFELQKKKVNISNPRAKFVCNDSLLVCESKMFPVLDSLLVLDTLFVEDNCKYLMRVMTKQEFQSNSLERLVKNKINEIKENEEWNSSIKKKAVENKISYEEQLMKDAVWNLLELNKITDKDVDQMIR